MTIQILENEYKDFLEKTGDEKRAEKEKAYLYLDLEFYGIKTADKRKFLKEYYGFLRSLPKEEALAAIEHFWESEKYDFKSLSLHILNMHADSLTKADMPLIEKMTRESRGWAFLDSLVIPIMPKILTKYPETYSYLKKWINDDDFWVRRSALLSQLLFFRQDNGGDRELFFDLARSQFDEDWINDKYKDPEMRKRARFFIRKAIGWTLREMSEKQPMIVFEYLKKYKSEMSGLTFREGSRKLPKNLQDKLTKS